uniref:Uncharacterized protein n=1 Tax=Euplotes crassus TaxID=5936 RepID=A0A7S3KSI7_EUPCR|mmetsp:Transcript_639/g.647  ORF Transcript_639/g.647 Transcript_639/m.647 type:complete len:168 (-) Transcript_639:25-528(-)
MSDFTNKLNKFKLYYVPPKTVVEKDIQKEEAYDKYTKAVSMTLAVPLFLQGYQITLINKPGMSSTFNRISKLKWLSVLGATGLGLYHLFELDKRLTYLNRIYPEKTEYQKNLSREAVLHKLRGEQQGKKQFTAQETQIYKKMYSLGSNPSAKATKSYIPVDFKPDDE